MQIIDVTTSCSPCFHLMLFSVTFCCHSVSVCWSCLACSVKIQNLTRFFHKKVRFLYQTEASGYKYCHSRIARHMKTPLHQLTSLNCQLHGCYSAFLAVIQFSMSQTQSTLTKTDQLEQYFHRYTVNM